MFGEMIDVAWVGEGARFIEVLLKDGYDAAATLPESWVPGDTREVIPNEAFPWGVPPLRHPDGTIRVFGSRGCRYKCLFCQTGWESSYRVHPEPALLQAQIDALTRKGYRLAIVTNDGAESHVVLRGQQEFLSVRLSNLKRLMPISRQRVKSVRIGVEGVSERLRVAVGKPVSDDDLVSVTAQCLAAGVGVRWFFIVGLPGEIHDDYEGLRRLVRRAHALRKGCVMMNFHAFIPQPATPLGVLPLNDKYWEPFDEFRRWFFHGPGFTRRIQIVAPAQYKGRLKRARESMAASAEELRRGWFGHDNANWRVQYPIAPDRLRHAAHQYMRVLTNGVEQIGTEQDARTD